MIVFGLLFIISFISKPLIHVYLGNKNDNPIVFSGVAASIEVFWFYIKPVSEEYKNIKKVCNYMHAYNMIYFSIEFIIAIQNSINK
jgi:hypothetical protein